MHKKISEIIHKLIKSEIKGVLFLNAPSFFNFNVVGILKKIIINNWTMPNDPAMKPTINANKIYK